MSITPQNLRNLFSPAGITLLVGLLLSILAFNMARSWENIDIRSEFNRAAENHIAAIKKAIGSNLLVLESLGSFYGASREVDRREFREFVTPILSQNLTIQALEWIPRVPASERSSYEKAAQLEGFPDFQITERQAHGKMVKADQRVEYFPVYFVEPFRGNETALGFDLASNPTRKEALDRSRDSRKMVATARITLVQETGEKYGLLVFRPVFQKGNALDTIAARRKHLEGFVLGVFRIGDIVQSALADLAPAGIDILLYDHSAPVNEDLLYFHGSRTRQKQLWWPKAEEALGRSELRYSHTLDVAGRKWSIECSETPYFMAAGRSWQPWLASLALLLCTAIVAVYFIVNTRRGARLSKAYQDLQTEIIERRRSEEALRESEERFRNSFDNAPIGMALVDINERFIRVNHALCNILGYTPDELLSKTVPAIMHPDDRELESEYKMQIFGGTSNGFRMIKRYIRSDGNIVWGKLSVSPVLDKQKNPLYYIGQLEDITQQKEAETKLQEAEQRYRTFFEQSPDAVVIIDPETTLPIEFNDNVLHLLGYSRKEFSKLKIRNYEAVESPEEIKQHIEESFARGREQFETKMRTKDGRIIDVLESIQVIELFGKRVCHNIFRDITEQKNLEAQLLQSQKMEAIGTLAGGVAHDFNNLLQAVQGYAELLQSGRNEDDPDYRDLQQIYSAACRASQLTRQLLTFGRKVKSNKQPVDLNHEVRTARDLMDRTIPKMIEIELQLEEDLKRINADPVQIEQILLNLAVNAMDSMPEGGKLTIATHNTHLDEEYCKSHVGSRPGEYVLLTVSDTGHGMSQEILDHIFEPFFTTKKGGRGTGLGLATVYGIVKSHEGYIACTSGSGKGTAFKIFLPVILQVAELQAPQTAEINLQGGTETVLVVDDEDTIRDLGERILTKQGYRVHSAPDGESALAVYRQDGEQIDLVILDMIMPGMGGRKCLETLFKMNPRARVVIASGYSADDPVKEIMEVGAKAFIRKPYQINQLLKVVREVLDQE